MNRTFDNAAVLDRVSGSLQPQYRTLLVGPTAKMLARSAVVYAALEGKRVMYVSGSGSTTGRSYGRYAAHVTKHGARLVDVVDADDFLTHLNAGTVTTDVVVITDTHLLTRAADGSHSRDADMHLAGQLYSLAAEGRTVITTHATVADDRPFGLHLIAGGSAVTADAHRIVHCAYGDEHEEAVRTELFKSDEARTPGALFASTIGIARGSKLVK
jgi:hypothetical protein